MRITSGEYRGKKIEAPKTDAVRPTSDKVRQAIFNMLLHSDISIDCANVLDLFCGTGALGIEALSNNARSALFIDRDISLVIKNVSTILPSNISKKVKCIRRDLSKGGKIPNDGAKFDLVFMDPPYSKGYASIVLKELEGGKCLNNQCVIVIEAEKDFQAPVSSNYVTEKEKIYGDTKIIFLKYLS